MTYIVQTGDTLFLIAKRFGSTVNAIVIANPQITNPNIIFPGQTIVVPPVNKVCPFLHQGDTGHEVLRLQTLLRVAGYNPGPLDGKYGPKTQAALTKFMRTVKEIEFRGFVDTEVWVALGADCEPQSVITTYIVRPGESLYIIATRFDITVQQLLKVNPQITNPDIVSAGQTINIPPR